jgi:hypothetical protein
VVQVLDQATLDLLMVATAVVVVERAQLITQMEHLLVQAVQDHRAVTVVERGQVAQLSLFKAQVAVAV